MPMPLSLIYDRDAVADSARAHGHVTAGHGVNFTALDRRLRAICLSARRSARSCRSGAICADERQTLFLRRGPTTTRRASAMICSSIEFFGSELEAAGLDLRHVEHVVDDVEQVLPALADVAAIFVIFVGAERAEHACLHDLGEADDGVERRAQFVAHIGQEFRLGLVGFLGAGSFPRRISRQGPSSCCLRLRADPRSSRSAAARCSISLRLMRASAPVMSVPTET